MNEASPWKQATKTQWDIFRYEGNVNRKLFDTAQKLRSTKNFSFNDLLGKGGIFAERKDIPDSLKEELSNVGRILMGVLNELGHPAASNSLKNVFSPQQGPADVYTMRFCLLIYLREVGLHKRREEVFPEGFDEAHEILEEALNVLGHEFRDLPTDEVNKKIKADFEALTSYAGHFSINLPEMVGFVRYFIEHNDGKISPDTASYLAAVMQKIMTVTGLLDASILRDEGVQLQDFWHAYQRPKADEIADTVKTEISEKYSKRRAVKLTEEFDKVRGLRPEGYREAVVFYYQDDKIIRDLRKRLFKTATTANGEDGLKKIYLKSVAEQEPQSLKELGLSDDDIEYVRSCGKIPVNPTTGKRYPVTVDHIHDREFGGINAHVNFTVMRDEDNFNKENLKRLQTMSLVDKEAGRWIITWVPEKSLQVGTQEKMSMAQMFPQGMN